MKTIRLLQLSDIHWKKQLDPADDYTDIRDLMLQDLGYYCQRTGNNFDKILICGDIAFSGSADEYKRANSFIRELCKTVDCKTEEVYTVPGNHDKNVNEHPKCVREFIHQAISNRGNDRDWWWNKMVDEDFSFIKKLYTPFKEYNYFCNDERDNAEPFMLRALELGVDRYDGAEMFWHSEFEDNLEGYQVNLYGVNSALISDLNDYDTDPKRTDGHRLFLPQIAYRGAKCKDGLINILMCHHPLDFLLNKDTIAKDLDKRYALQLYGHVHIANSNVNNNAVHIYSGSLNPGNVNDNTYKPVYNIIELSIEKHDNKNDVLKVDLRVQMYDGEQFVKDEEQSKPLKVTLKKHDGWKDCNKIAEAIEQKLPDGLSKRDVRHMFKQCPNSKEIIKKMYPKIDCTGSAYMRNQVFLEKIREDNRWVELYNMIK